MKVLLLGSNGMLGQAIFKRFAVLGIDILSAARKNADFCMDFTDDNSLKECVLKIHPQIIVNTAAIVDLDYCEKNRGDAYQVNARIPGILSEICKNLDIYSVHISTDHYYVKGGSAKHAEIENVTLVNEYARTKYLGEQLALTNENSLVLRTNIVGFRGIGKPTFVEWAIQELQKGTELNLYNDFYTSSMHTNDFANILVDVINEHPVGIYNLASSDVSSKKDFIIALSKALFHRNPIYRETSVMNINGPKRAASLGLNTSKIEDIVGYRMPGLEKTIDSIKNEYFERKKMDEI